MKQIDDLDRMISNITSLSLNELMNLSNKDIRSLRKSNLRLIEFTSVINSIFKYRNTEIKMESDWNNIEMEPYQIKDAKDRAIYEHINKNPGITATELRRIFPQNSVISGIRVLIATNMIKKRNGRKVNSFGLYPTKIPKSAEIYETKYEP